MSDIKSKWDRLNTEQIESKISRSFGSKAHSYNKFALVQRFAANRLIEKLPADSPEINHILEAGCGTGFISKELVTRYVGKHILLTDISENMLAVCKDYLNLGYPDITNVEFIQFDAENEKLNKSFDLIVSGLTAQWFADFKSTMERLISLVNPGGQIILSYLTDNSFPEWKHMCEISGVECTANDLPKPDEIRQIPTSANIILEPFQLELRFSKSLDFFRSLKAIGASAQKNNKRLSTAEFSQLRKTWDSRTTGCVSVTYKGELAIIQK